jgi:hypothetical protein
MDEDMMLENALFPWLDNDCMGDNADIDDPCEPMDEPMDDPMDDWSDDDQEILDDFEIDVW